MPRGYIKLLGRNYSLASRKTAEIMCFAKLICP